MRARIGWGRVVVAATAVVVLAACSDGEDGDDGPDPPAAVDEDGVAEPAAPDEPAGDASDEPDERGPAPDAVAFEDLTVDEQEGTQDLCAAVASGSPVEALAESTSQARSGSITVAEYLEWVIDDASADDQDLVVAVAAACDEIGWPPEM